MVADKVPPENPRRGSFQNVLACLSVVFRSQYCFVASLSHVRRLRVARSPLADDRCVEYSNFALMAFCKVPSPYTYYRATMLPYHNQSKTRLVDDVYPGTLDIAVLLMTTSTWVTWHYAWTLPDERTSLTCKYGDRRGLGRCVFVKVLCSR